MSGENFFSGMFQPVVLNTQGQITCAAGYKAKFYEAGTAIAKTIYTDPDLLVPYSTPSNIAYLDDTGKALIYLGVGGYKLVLTDPNDVPVPGYTIDNIVGGGTTFGTGFVNSFADLKDVNTDIYPYTYIGGYYTPGDGGEGMFWNATSAQALDGGYVQESEFDPTKRWFRIPDENGDVRAASFGFCGSGNKTINLQAADSYAALIGATLRIQNDPCTATSVTLTAPSVVFNDTAALYAGAGTNTLTINGIVEAGNWRIFSGWDTINLGNESQVSTPYWFGGVPDGDPDDNATAFTKWINAGAGLYLLPGGNWPHTGTFTPSSVSVTQFNGRILTGAGPGVQIYSGVYYPGLESKVHASIVEFSNNAFITRDDANGIQTDDDFTAGGNIGAGESISAGGDVTAGGQIQAQGGSVSASTNVTAGGYVSANQQVEAGTYLQARAGTSVQSYKASGPMQVVVNTGSCTLPASALINTNSYIKIVAAGTSTATPTQVVIKVGSAGAGANEVFNQTLSVSGGSSARDYRVEVIVVRTGATTASCSGILTVAGTGVGNTNDTVVQFKTATIDWSVSNTIVQEASATETERLLLYEVYPV